MEKKEWLKKFKSESPELDMKTLEEIMCCMREDYDFINLVVSIEEMTELAKEICKYMRSKESPSSYSNINSLLEEMADVVICTLRVYCHISELSPRETMDSISPTFLDTFKNGCDLHEVSENYFLFKVIKHLSKFQDEISTYLMLGGGDFTHHYRDILCDVYTLMKMFKIPDKDINKAMNIKIHKHKQLLQEERGL